MSIPYNASVASHGLSGDALNGQRGPRIAEVAKNFGIAPFDRVISLYAVILIPLLFGPVWVAGGCPRDITAFRKVG
jgi:hypothetical protein